MDGTKAVTYPCHMVHSETNLSMVYIQNSGIQARSRGKPPFHWGWQLELHWEQLWNVSSFTHGTCARFQQLLGRNAGPRPSRSSCSRGSRCCTTGNGQSAPRRAPGHRTAGSRAPASTGLHNPERQETKPVQGTLSWAALK